MSPTTESFDQGDAPACRPSDSGTDTEGAAGADVLQQLKAFDGYMAGGGTLRELFHIDRLNLEIVYAYGCQRYRQGDHEGARQIFLALVGIDPRSFDYWLSLGLALQKLQRHDEAIACFAKTAVMRMYDPRSSFFAGVSFQLQADLEHARQAFEAAIKWCGRQEAYQTLREQAVQSLQAVLSSKQGEVQ